MCSDLAFSGASDQEIASELAKHGFAGILSESEFELTVMMARRAKKKQPKIEFLLTRILALAGLLWGIVNVLQSRAEGGKMIQWRSDSVPVEWLACPAIALGLCFLFKPAFSADVAGWLNRF